MLHLASAIYSQLEDLVTDVVHSLVQTVLIGYIY